MVGAAAKGRIDSVKELSHEVEFDVIQNNTDVAFRVPFHTHGNNVNDGRQSSSSTSPTTHTQTVSIAPHQVGSYVVNHLMKMTRDFLGHDNVRSAVIAVPAKFNQAQIEATARAFKEAGVSVARILEEPVAAALAYGLQKKEHVDYILVYDFGGGTLDVSMLQVFEGGYVEVMGNDGDNRLGGADFDAIIAHSLLEMNGGMGRMIVERVTRALRRIEENEEDMEELSRHNVQGWNQCLYVPFLHSTLLERR